MNGSDKLRQEIEELKSSLGLVQGQLNGIAARIEKLESGVMPSAANEKAAEASTAGQEASKPIKSPASKTILNRGQDQFNIAKERSADNNNGSDLEIKIGSNLLNRIGIVAIIMGMAFFLKYAFDNQWIGESGRVIIGILAGMALIGSGERYQKKSYRYFAQGLTGGGMAILYLSVFAAHGLYNLIPFGVAIALIALIVTFSVLQSLRHDAMAISFLGFLGGYLAPFILSNPQQGGGSPASLYAYTIALSVGIVVLSTYRRWSALVFLGAFSSYMCGILWSASNSTQSYYWFEFGFYALVFALFSMASIAYSVRLKTTASQAMTVLVLFNSAFYATISFIILNTPYSKYLGLFSMILALVHFVLAYMIYRLNSNDKILSLMFAGLSLLFVTITVPLQLDGSWFALAWAVEAVVLTWIGTRYSVQYLMFIGMFILFLAYFGLTPPLLESEQPTDTYLQQLLTRALSFVPVITATFYIGYLYNLSGKKYPGMHSLSQALVIVANLTLLGYLSNEAYQLIGSYHAFFGINSSALYMAQLLAITVLWSLYAFALIAIGIFRKARQLRIMAIALLFAMIFKLYLVDLATLDTIYRIMSFVVLGLILVAVSLAYQKYGNSLLGLVGVDIDSRDSAKQVKE
jgi:uncharacterized membrane protein